MITLGSSLPVGESLIVNGPGPSLLTISGNDATTIFSQFAGDFTISGVKLTGANSSGAKPGGAISFQSGGTLTVLSCWFTSNVASEGGGAIGVSNGGSLLVEGCTLTGNNCGPSGGGGAVSVSSLSTMAGPVVIEDSTIVGNTTSSFHGGGGVFVDHTTNPVIIQNCTITGNTATDKSSGDDGGGGVCMNGEPAAMIASCIISGNLAGSGAADFSDGDAYPGTLLSNDAIGAQSAYTPASGSASNLTTSNSTLAALNLGPLQNNGGPTPTLLPGPGSTALDAGSNSGSLLVDQRGLPRVYGTAADIGAVEIVPAGVPFVSASSESAFATGADESFTATFQNTGGVSGIVVSTIIGNNAAIQVTGPNGFSRFASFVGIDNPTNGTPRTTSYAVLSPGSAWTGADDGTYTISLVSNQVANTSGSFIPAEPIGTFRVLLPRTLTVTNTNDSGPGSFRQAVLDANDDATVADTIAFSNTTNGGATNFYDGVQHTISLLSAPPTISDDLTILGPGPTLLTVAASASASMPFRVIAADFSPTRQITVSGLTLSGGYTSGGDILAASGSFTLANDVISGNTATSSGGIIEVTFGGSLTVENSSISGNSAATNGGGIYFSTTGSLLVDGSTISRNTAGSGGGGIFVAGTVQAGRVTVRNSTIAGNTAATGGGIHLGKVTGNILVQNCTIVGTPRLPPPGPAAAASRLSRRQYPTRLSCKAISWPAIPRQTAFRTSPTPE